MTSDPEPPPGDEALVRSLQALLERLATVWRRITNRADLQETLDVLTAGAAELLGESIAALRLVEEDDPGFSRLVAAVGLEDWAVERLRRSPVVRGAAGRSIERDELIVLEGYQEAPFANPVLLEVGIEASIAAPIRDARGVIGSLVVGSRTPGRRFQDHELAALRAFSEQAGLALMDARTVAQALHQAVHDALTGLPNRTLFADRIQHALDAAPRRGTQVAVLFCDLDDFKVVNDSLGHQQGDGLLVEVASRLRSGLRAGDTVARFGGDEFGILLEEVGDVTDAVRVAELVVELLASPFRVGVREHVIGCSIGIALSGPGSDTPEALVRDADAAMYRAKTRGRGGHEVFDEAMRTRALARLRTEAELRRAIAGGELRVHYQPIVTLPDGLLLGAEALVRWQHPERGMLPPADFIAIAEQSGLVVPIGRWVLEEACREAAGWADPGLTVSVNLSPRQVGDGLIEAVADAITRSRLEPGRLALEITEGTLLEDSDAARGTLKALKALGVQLVLDDFGTGYSSLGYLKRLPLDGLKIDRSFVDGLGTDADDSAIVSAVAGMAASLGLTLIAEGVETDAQLAELRRLACERAQGFLFGRPMGPRGFARLVAGDELPQQRAAARPA